jgi:hypothetical protein
MSILRFYCYVYISVIYWHVYVLMSLFYAYLNERPIVLYFYILKLVQKIIKLKNTFSSFCFASDFQFKVSIQLQKYMLWCCCTWYKSDYSLMRKNIYVLLKASCLYLFHMLLYFDFWFCNNTLYLLCNITSGVQEIRIEAYDFKYNCQYSI